ncbi:MAG: DMT family transporter [Ruminococcaceae bacterium]|nr:DMT family transporter [Oscillospiraceae bacterium]
MSSQHHTRGAYFSLVSAMTVFGTIGLFRRLIPLPSGAVALVRGMIGTLTLLLFMLITQRKPDYRAIRRHLWLLCLSGAFIGFNWILLFEAYRYTTVATATLCYYMAPILVLIAAPFLLREKPTARQTVCVLVALGGMIPVSGILEEGLGADIRGVLFGLSAAVLYASVVLCNKRLSDVGAFDRTVLQLGSAAVVLLPYTLLAERVELASVTWQTVLLLLLIGVLHTGVAYAAYFGAIGGLRAQTVALLGYIDPVIAIFLSVLFLKEPMTWPKAVGALMILGAALVAELPARKRPTDGKKREKGS